LTSNLTSVLGGNGATGLFDVFGVGSDVAGLGGDGAGLGADGAGLGFDGYGLSLDFAGLGSISGADGIPGAGAASGLGSAGSLPGLGEAASASVGHAASLGTLSVPPGWAQAVSAVTPLPAFDANVTPGGSGATPSPAAGTAVSKLPLGGMVGRESDGAVQRIGFCASVIPRSPVAGVRKSRAHKKPGPHTNRCAAPVRRWVLRPAAADRAVGVEHVAAGALHL
jgi:hypothetical protein